LKGGKAEKEETSNRRKKRKGDLEFAASCPQRSTVMESWILCFEA